MALTKKDYTAIARIIAKQLEGKRFAGERSVIGHLTVELAAYFKKENPHFRGDTFLEACAPYGYEGHNRTMPLDKTGDHDD